MPSPGILRYSCSANGCNNKYYNPILIPECVNKTFFKFPEKNPSRRQQWFSIMMLQETNKTSYLCEDHFEASAFTTTAKDSGPSDETSVEESVAGPSCEVLAGPSCEVLAGPSCEVLAGPSCEVLAGPSCELLAEPRTPQPGGSLETKGARTSILRQVGVSRFKNLTPRKALLYNVSRSQQVTICKLRKSLFISKSKLKYVYEDAQSDVLGGLERNLDSVGIQMLKSIVRNAQCKRPSWTTRDKIFALTLYKKGPKGYNFLKRCLPLPSKSTIQKVLQGIPIDVGLNKELLKNLLKRISKFGALNRCCTIVFDEIALSEQAVLDRVSDKIVGLVDLGSLGRKNELANQALVFMAQGLYKKWKQPLAFYFTRGTIQTADLKHLLLELIEILQSIGLEVMGTVCDQGATNRAAIRQLCHDSQTGRSDYYFRVNNKKIFCLFDPPHLLKSTRNAFLKYNIQFENHKMAKSCYVEQCLDLDQTRKFRSAPKMRKEYINLERYPQYKMKVSIAAKTLSQTVAAMLETSLSFGALPSESIYTIDFIADMDHLFDSFNGCRPRPVEGKRYRTCISSRSLHLDLWDELLPKIKSWVFCSKDGRTRKSSMPFKSGWLRTINSTRELWTVCSQEKGFQFLRTRALNQDCLENMFAAIRHYGATNSHPNCYQFISSFKTALLNNLITPASNKNCEPDEESILYNLESLIENTIPLPVHSFQHNELDNVELPPEIDSFVAYESQAVSYVAGFLLRKLKNYNSCEDCASILRTGHLESQHLFTTFKEYDDKRRLVYPSENVTFTLIKIYDIVVFILPSFGHILSITLKLKSIIENKLLFSWFTCQEHSESFVSDFLDCSISLIVRKYYDDIYRKKQLERRRNKMTRRKL